MSLEGVYTLYLDAEWTTAGLGDTVRMPMGLAHAYFNKADAAAKALFSLSPSGQLAQLLLVKLLAPREEAVRLVRAHPKLTHVLPVQERSELI